MGLFSKKESSIKAKAIAKINEIKKNVVEFVDLGRKDNSAIEGESFLFISAENKARGSEPIFSAVGEQKQLIELIYYAALEDEHFGKILITAAEAAVFKDSELKELQDQLKASSKKVSKKLKARGLDLGDISSIENMTEEQIKALAKKLIDDKE